MTITRKPWFLPYQVDLPDMENSTWSVNHFEIAEGEKNIKLLRLAMAARGLPPGRYTRLHRKRSDGTFNYTDLVMSDTPAEITDHLPILSRLTGRVLINGLGLGMVLRAALRTKSVTHVDVVEISRDLIYLVGPYYSDPRVVIHHADAYEITWPVGTRWDVAWHDIWDNICADNLPGMSKLHHKYGKRVGWQGSWGRDLARRGR